LLGRVAPCLEEEGIGGDEVLRNSEVAELESFVRSPDCRTSCTEAVLWASGLQPLSSGFRVYFLVIIKYSGDYPQACKKSFSLSWCITFLYCVVQQGAVIFTFFAFLQRQTLWWLPMDP
jgi:hypothetical protein